MCGDEWEHDVIGLCILTDYIIVACECGYTSRKRNVQRHTIGCCKWRDIEIARLQSKAQEVDRLYTATQTLQAEIDKLTKENDELRRRPTTINDNNNSVSVNILAYGQEPASRHT